MNNIETSCTMTSTPSVINRWYELWSAIKKDRQNFATHKFADELAVDMFEQIEIMEAYLNLPTDDEKRKFLVTRQEEKDVQRKIVMLGVVLFHFFKKENLGVEEPPQPAIFYG